MKLKKKQRVRVHFVDATPSIEGILIGRGSGHYMLFAADLLEETDRTVKLDGHVAIPRERVLFLQVLG